MQGKSEDRSTVAAVVSSLLPTAEAGPQIPPQGPRQWSCLTTDPGWTTASVDGLIINSIGSAQVSADNIPVGGAAVSLSITQCRGDDSEIGQATIQITFVDANKAVGQYVIGGGQNTIPFELPIGNCSAPGCVAMSIPI